MMWMRVLAVLSIFAGWTSVNLAAIFSAATYMPDFLSYARAKSPYFPIFPPAGEMSVASILVFGLPGSLLLAGGWLLWLWAGVRERYEDERRRFLRQQQDSDSAWEKERKSLGRWWRSASILAGACAAISAAWFALSTWLQLSGIARAGPYHLTPAEAWFGGISLFSLVTLGLLVVAAGCWKIGAAEVARIPSESPVSTTGPAREP